MAKRIQKKQPVIVKVDVALKKLYAEAIRALERATAEGAKSWDVRYEAIGDIVEHEPPLYLAGGYSTETDFFAQVVQENRQSVYRNMRVAKYANPDEIEKYTTSKLDLAITSVETKNGGPLKGRNPIDFAKLRFAFKRDGKTVTKSMNDVVVSELRDSIALLKGKEASSKKASPLAKAIDAVLKKTNVKGASASVTASQVALRVPTADFDTVARAFANFKSPQK